MSYPVSRLRFFCLASLIAFSAAVLGCAGGRADEPAAYDPDGRALAAPLDESLSRQARQLVAELTAAPDTPPVEPAADAQLAGAGQGAASPILPIVVSAVREELAAFRLSAIEWAAALPRAEPRETTPAPALDIPTISLCREVTDFGIYEPLAPQFPAGKRRKAIVYVEVDAFHAQETQDGRWETRLLFSATLLDPRGRAVLSVPESPVVDLSRQRRRDFFICADLTIPGSLRPGRHTLVVTVKDELTGQTAQRRMELELIEP